MSTSSRRIRWADRARGACLALALGCPCAALAQPSECVVLLHGLARTSASMEPMEELLREAGYAAVNFGYPSREAPIEVLAPRAVERGVAGCRALGAERIHFVTHSLGGILVRFYLESGTIAGLGRVVMLAPPNHGSEAVDALADVPGFDLINGPAGHQLGTGEQSVPRRLGPAWFEVGVIAGDRSINLVLSSYLPNPDDGKVSVASARLEGMRDFLVEHVSHPFIMRDDRVMRETVHFLRHGRFSRSDL